MSGTGWYDAVSKSVFMPEKVVAGPGVAALEIHSDVRRAERGLRREGDQDTTGGRPADGHAGTPAFR